MLELNISILMVTGNHFSDLVAGKLPFDMMWETTLDISQEYFLWVISGSMVQTLSSSSLPFTPVRV